LSGAGSFDYLEAGQLYVDLGREQVLIGDAILRARAMADRPPVVHEDAIVVIDLRRMEAGNDAGD
jgi:hypothetical protein